MRAGFEPTSDQLELIRSIEATIDRFQISGPLDGSAWRSLGDLGVLALGTEAGGGTTSDLVAAAGSLGWACVQGPLLGAVLGARALADRTDAIGAGAMTVGIAADGFIAWHTADVVLAVEADGSWCTATIEEASPFETLADEPWARGTVRPDARVNVAPADVAAVELVRAAWLVGAGRRCVDLAAAHARDRTQFGQPIGTFQGVAHPLAMSAAELGAARDLAGMAAIHLDAGAGDALQLATAARQAATDAALAAAFASHQVHGAIGFSAERGLDRWTAAIRQLSHHPPRATTTLLGPDARRH